MQDLTLRVRVIAEGSVGLTDVSMQDLTSSFVLGTT